MDVLPNRKHPRLKEYNYSQSGCYFVTICTDKRRNLLGKITVEEIAPDVCRGGALLRPLGMMVEEEIKNLQNRYAVTVDKYVIMPNHVHIIVILSSKDGSSRTPTPTNMRLPSLISTLKRFTNRVAGVSLWQRSYYDHVIRNEADYLRIWQYIDENPAKWTEDEYYI